ncbi:hypothetical protein BST43_26015 [Mycobacteroides saopaulense]|uniref:Uncharacterized protein n=1 Tax=Mycobacteroides saopaulense TaxID=1578165 RepID=A0A1X0IIK6_9MYCO|nr:hypothetical protein BST43_26015 [Mycobacteroides saopaulense]
MLGAGPDLVRVDQHRAIHPVQDLDQRRATVIERMFDIRPRRGLVTFVTALGRRARAVRVVLCGPYVVAEEAYDETIGPPVQDLHLCVRREWALWQIHFGCVWERAMTRGFGGGRARS